MTALTRFIVNFFMDLSAPTHKMTSSRRYSQEKVIDMFNTIENNYKNISDRIKQTPFSWTYFIFVYAKPDDMY